jgi:hypothetical protein
MDKRIHRRFPTQFRSTFSSVYIADGEGQAINLSLRGCCVNSTSDVRPGTMVQIHLYVSDGKLPIQIDQAIVHWHLTTYFGVEFVSLSPESEARIQQIVKQLELQS